MKTIIFYLAIILVFILLSFSSNAKKVEVKLQKNEVLIYEWTEKEVFTTSDLKPVPDWVQTNRFSITITNQTGSKLNFTAQMQKKTERHLQAVDIYTKDYAFPDLMNYFWEIWEPETSEGVLYPLLFKYELDLNSGSINLVNRTEILEQCHKSLIDKGYPDQSRSIYIKRINSEMLQQQSKLFLRPFLLVNSDPEHPSIGTEKNKTNLSVVKRTNEILELKNSATDSIPSMNCRINLQTGVLNSLTEEKLKEKNENVRSISLYNFGKNFKKVNELKLIKQGPQKPEKLIVCGRIENPVNDHITLYSLNRAFGTEPDSKDVNLDKAGNFRIETKFRHSGLVILMQPNKKQNINTAAFLLYAEPGDSIYVKSGFAMKKVEIEVKMNKSMARQIDAIKKLSNNDVGQKILRESLEKLNYPSQEDTVVKSSIDIMMYESVEFSGDHKTEADFLMKYQQEWGLPPYIPALNNVLLFNKGNLGIGNYLDALAKLDQILPQYQKRMSSESATFIKHELQVLLYGFLCVAKPARLFLSSVTPGTDLIPAYLENQINDILDTIHIQQIYNDYGIFSRDFAQKYVSYKYMQFFPFRTIFIPTPGYILPADVERMTQFTRMVLSGSALYRTLVQQLHSSTFIPKYFTRYQKIWQPYVRETLELIRKRSNDKDLDQEIDLLFHNQLEWTSTWYIPETQFLNLKRQKVSLKSVITGKPAIVFIGDHWSGARYEVDEMVPKFPGINFVLVNEGTNFDLWKDWNNRAESLSQQLFLLNDSIRLADVFQDKMNRFIVYNAKGERIGVEHELIPAIQIAKESLKAPKKEINKSTLQGIIIILVASMLFFLILFLAYKYRMKQRLKKQIQEKRLRELQMAAIRAQMNPHFLFNSLNSVQNLIQQNRAREAHLYLSDFAGLIRKVLRNSDKEEVSLAEELETLKQYLNLEKLRFDFDYSIEVDNEIDQNLFMLPSMILQPVAENALMHGLQHKTGDKKLSVRISKEKNSIQITIEDNGIGINEAKKLKTNSNGVGLRMNEERIQMMKEKYGGNYSFRLIDLSEQNQEGTRVEINIPEEI